MLKVLTLACLLASGGAAWAADAGACYGIADHDARMLCLARAHGDVGRCYAISDPGMRSACLAELRRR